MASWSDIAPYYTSGWTPDQAMNDFNSAFGGDINRLAQSRGSASPTSSSSGGGSNQLSAPDIAALRTQLGSIFSTAPTADNPHPYYYELAQQAKGDFNAAIKMMQGDYSQGTRNAKAQLALTNKYGTSDLNSALSSLGLTFNQENQQKVDNLNQRGMAVYEQGPNQQPNVVTPTTTGAGYAPSYDTNNYTYNSGVSTSPTEGLGRGGYELGQLRQDQGLRSEALLRSKMQPLEQAGLSYKQYTNPAAGYDPNSPGNYTGDLGQLGSAELNAYKTDISARQGLRSTLQQQADQRSQNINTLTQQYATQGVKQLGADTTNQLNKQYQTAFTEGGV